MNNSVFNNKYTLDYLVRLKWHTRKKLEALRYPSTTIDRFFLYLAGKPIDEQITRLRYAIKESHKGRRNYDEKIRNLLKLCDSMSKLSDLPYVAVPPLYLNTDKQIVEFLHNSLNDLNKKWAEKCRAEKKAKEKEEAEKKAEALAKAKEAYPSTSSWTRTGPNTFARDFSPIPGWVVKQVSERIFNVHHPHGVYNVEATNQSWALLTAMQREITILRERSADLHNTIADLKATLAKKDKDISFLKEWVNKNV